MSKCGHDLARHDACLRCLNLARNDRKHLLDALDLVLDGLGALGNPSELDGMGLSYADQDAIWKARYEAKEHL